MATDQFNPNGFLDDVPGTVLPQRVAPMVELGVTGVRRVSGYIEEEFLPQLRGRKAVQIYREMADNDATIGALLFAVERLLRELSWTVEPASQTPEDRANAEFVEQCMDDMSHSWSDLIAEILSMLTYGWSYHEIVYKKRIGPWEKDPSKKSKYDDGKIGWRKIPIRAQETLQRWIFDDDGSLQGMIQLAPPRYKMQPLPISKGLLFRTTSIKANPEGRSILRNAYMSWYYKKRIMEQEAIGIERDLAGLPVAKVPASYLSAPAGSRQAQMVEAFRKMVRSVRRDEQAGIIVPQEFDQDSKNSLFEFELLNSGGARQFDTNAIIDRYDLYMLQTVLADFIKVGHQDVGSYALHTDKTGMFRDALNSFADSIADVFNRYAIPRLFAVNGMKPKELPRIKPQDVDPPDLTQLGQFMTQMGQAGLTWFPDPELEKFLRQAARLPELDDEQEQVREVEYRQGNVMRLANQRLQYIQMQQQAAMGASQMQQGAQQAQDQTEMAPVNRQVQMAQAQQAMQQANDPNAEGKAKLDMARGQQKINERKSQQDLKFGADKHKMSMQQAKEKHDLAMRQAKDKAAMQAKQQAQAAAKKKAAAAKKPGGKK